MSNETKPQRSDAARNREIVMTTAYETFASEGLSVAIDEIARRAGVGAGTIYRHFPTKDLLFAAVIERRMNEVVAAGHDLMRCRPPSEAMYEYIRAISVNWGADLALAQAIAGQVGDMGGVIAHAETSFMGLLGELLAAAQRAGTARHDLSVHELKAIIVACQAIPNADATVAERATAIVLDGLRPPST